MSKPYNPNYPNAEYCEKHDAFFDKEKDIWLEKQCNDKECEFCVGRPVRPSFVGKKLELVKNK